MPQRQPCLCAINLRFHAGMKTISEGGEWKNTTSAVELNLPLDSTPGLLICKAGTSAQVMLNWLQALAGIIRFYSLNRRCLGDEGLIGSVESPCRFCSANRPQDKIKRRDDWVHLSPSERPQKTGSAWILISLRGGFLCFLPSLCLIPFCVPSSTSSYSTNSVLLLI